MYSEGAVTRSIDRLREMGALICKGGANRNRGAFRQTTFEGERLFDKERSLEGGYKLNHYGISV